MKYRDPIMLEPLAKPVAEDELRQRILDGYRMMGQAMVKVGSDLITPNNPTGQQQAMPVNVWVLGPSLFPADVLAHILIQSESKDELCQELFNMSLEELAEKLEEI